MQLNTPSTAPGPKTHEGAPAVRIGAWQELRRLTLAYLLWEDNFYESGKSVADRIAELIPVCEATDVMNLAIECRHQMKLRHAPLLIARAMAKHADQKKLLAHTLEAIIDRPDELTEFLAIYWKDDKNQPLSAQVKKGLARAFSKFNEYQLAKHEGSDKPIKLRDVLFMIHAKPADAKGKGKKAVAIERPGYKRGPVQRHKDALFTKVVEKTLATPDTWEVALSGGADKKETFERLMTEGKLGALALLRNLRNMTEAGVDRAKIKDAMEKINVERVLPFRFIAAARAVPAMEDLIEPAMLKALDSRLKEKLLPGKTIILIDVSGSMDAAISAKSDLRRLDAACGLAILARELCQEGAVVTFSDTVATVAPRRGFALRDAIVGSQPHSGTMMGLGVQAANLAGYDRLIVITDEQSHDRVPDPKGRGYVINVASNQNGVGYGKWTHIDGWSEAVFDYIVEFEKMEKSNV